MKSKHIALLIWLVAIFVSTGCRHRDFCEHHWEHAPRTIATLKATYRIAWELPAETPYADWRSEWPAGLSFSYDDLLPGIPEGLRVWTFPPTRQPYSNNLEPHGGELYFEEEGNHSLLLHNNDTEAIQFDGMGSWVASKATTRTRYRSSYKGNPYYTPESRSERTVNTPDMVYGTYVTSYHVVAQAEPPELEVEMQPLVFTYVVIYGFEKGIEYVALARGALAGMAEGVWLTTGQTTDEAATLLYDCQVDKEAVIAIVQSFGVPGYPNPDYVRSNGRYALNLEVCLRNGKLLQYDFDVSDQVAAQPRGGVIKVGGITVKAEDGESKGSGFQVDVNEWGQDEDIGM